MARLRWVLLALAVSTAGCASFDDGILRGTGRAVVADYRKRGMTEPNAVKAARRDAALAAQKDLIERYALAVLSSPKAARKFAAATDRIIAETRGLVKGVHIVRIVLSPDRTACRVLVKATMSDLRQSLGDGPTPKDAPTYPIKSRGETGG